MPAPGKPDHSLIIELATLLVREPAAIEKLLEQHQADVRGHCRTCLSGAQRGNLSWPCTIYKAADVAAKTRAAALELFE